MYAHKSKEKEAFNTMLSLVRQAQTEPSINEQVWEIIRAAKDTSCDITKSGDDWIKPIGTDGKTYEIKPQNVAFSLLEVLCRAGSLEMVQAAYEKARNPNVRSWDEAMHMVLVAANCENDEVVKWLVQKDPSCLVVEDKDGLMLAHQAAYSNSEEMLFWVLKQAPEQLNHKSYGNEDLMDLIGARPEPKEPEWDDDEAPRRRYYSSYNRWDDPYDYDEPEQELDRERAFENEGQTPLMCWLNGGFADAKILKDLLTMGADPYEVDARGNSSITGLFRYCKVSEPSCGHNVIKIMDTLVECGVDLNRPDDMGWTPLSAAVLNGDIPTIDALMLRGAKLQIPEHYAQKSKSSKFKSQEPYQLMKRSTNEHLREWIAALELRQELTDKILTEPEVAFPSIPNKKISSI